MSQILPSLRSGMRCWFCIIIIILLAGLFFFLSQISYLLESRWLVLIQCDILDLVWPGPWAQPRIAVIIVTLCQDFRSFWIFNCRNIFCSYIAIILISCPNDLPVPINFLLVNDNALVCDNFNQWEARAGSGGWAWTNEVRAILTMDNHRVSFMSRWPYLISTNGNTGSDPRHQAD